MSSRRALAGLALAAATVLSGCAGLNPGLAYEVGDARATTSEVDGLTDDVCRAISDNEQFQGPVPLSGLRAQVAESLALAEIAPDLLAEAGISIDADVEEAMAGVRADLPGLPAEIRDGYERAVEANLVTLISAQALVIDALGEEFAASAPPGALVDQGRSLLWAAAVERGVELNPRYGFEVVDGAVVPASGSVSFAVSELALQGQEPGNPQYAAGLPASQVCG